jgi:hypothetical protein
MSELWPRALFDAVLTHSTFQSSRLHGLAHWRRVTLNALADETPGAAVEVAILFGIFHDSVRENDGYDPDTDQGRPNSPRRCQDCPGTGSSS